MDLDLYLQRIYSSDADLVVVWACEPYSNKTWCRIEWRAIRSIINARKNDEIMIIKMDDAQVPGLMAHDGFIDGRKYAGEQITQFILERLGKLSARENPRFLSE